MIYIYDIYMCKIYKQHKQILSIILSMIYQLHMVYLVDMNRPMIYLLYQLVCIYGCIRWNRWCIYKYDARDLYCITYGVYMVVFVVNVFVVNHLFVLILLVLLYPYYIYTRVHIHTNINIDSV